ncbi:MAG: copper homeostasis membrane protein CopD [Bradyrhizobium sp.]
MDWWDVGDNGPLIAVRAVHFAATAVTTGTVVFRTMVAKGVLGSEQAAAGRFRTKVLGVAWIALALAVASGVIWLLLQAAAMSGLPVSEATTAGVLSTVVNQTQFGFVSEIRLGLAVVVAACLACDRLALKDGIALAAAVGLSAALAWSGHAGATPGPLGNLHLAADVLHLIAAASWIGGLVPLVLLLALARHNPSLGWASIAGDSAQRFSILGIVSVATLFVTGIVNAWILVGSFHALFATQYGQLLMLKIMVFAIMLAFAAVNRLALTPRLAGSPESAARIEALRRLTRNSMVEIGLGLIIFAMVGMLGTLHPAIHQM